MLFVGYQSPGSLGRMLADGSPSVHIFGEKIPVRASVHTLSGLSGHAGQSDLLRCVSFVVRCPPARDSDPRRGRRPAVSGQPHSRALPA